MSLDRYKELKPVSVANLNRIQSSRFFSYNTYQTDDGRPFYESWIAPIASNSPDDRYTVVDSGEEGRLDLVSNRLYGTPRWWWVLAVYNDIFDPFEEVTVGLALRYPSQGYLISIKSKMR